MPSMERKHWIKLSASAFDILFLDLNMPVKDGYETLEALQSFDSSPAVIVVSGDVQPKAIQRVKEMGAVAFHKKPASAEELRALLISLGLFSVQGSDQDNDLQPAVTGTSDGSRGSLLSMSACKKFLISPWGVLRAF